MVPAPIAKAANSARLELEVIDKAADRDGKLNSTAASSRASLPRPVPLTSEQHHLEKSSSILFIRFRIY